MVEVDYISDAKRNSSAQETIVRVSTDADGLGMRMNSSVRFRQDGSCSHRQGQVDTFAAPMRTTNKDEETVHCGTSQKWHPIRLLRVLRALRGYPNYWK